METSNPLNSAWLQFVVHAFNYQNSNVKYSENLCNTYTDATINCVFQCDIKTDFPKSGYIYDPRYH